MIGATSLTVHTYVALFTRRMHYGYGQDPEPESVGRELFETEEERDARILEVNSQVPDLDLANRDPKMFADYRTAVAGETIVEVFAREDCFIGLLIEREKGWGQRVIDERLFDREWRRNKWLDEFNRRHNPGMYVENPSPPESYIIATKG